jgi:hypothetical protein
MWVLSGNEDNNEGICYDKDDERLECNNVTNEEQCKNGLGDSSLKGICEIVGDEKECLERCEKRDEKMCSGEDSDRIDCVWILGKTKEEEKCIKKGNIRCEDLKTSGQCEDDELGDCTWSDDDDDGCYSSCETFKTLNNCEEKENCFWLEGVLNGDIDGDEEEGRCVERSSVLCSSISIGQCNDEKLSSLNIECGIYEGSCKELCSSLNDNKDKCDEREDDCYWIKIGEKNEYQNCINKVLFYKF